MKTIFLALCLLPLATACSSGPLAKAALDDEVRRLCAIDGGIKVYEMVKLPAEKFNQWGQVNFWIPTNKDMKPADHYYYELVDFYYRQGNPEMWRSHFTLYRTADKKVLGEAISYSRRGGDVPGPWHESAYGCTIDADLSVLKQRVFKSETENQRGQRH